MEEGEPVQIQSDSMLGDHERNPNNNQDEFQIKFEYKETIKNKFTSIEDVLDKRFAFRMKPVEIKIDPDPRSLYLFKINNPIRRFCTRVINWKPYEYFIMAMIVLNTILLAIIDYQNPNSNSLRNLIPSYMESYFIVVFSTEAIMKIISLGFVIKKGSYLRDPWNCLDFFVVMCSFISIIPGIDNYTFLRTFRLFRPLRNFRSIPYMKTLIGTVISSMFGLTEILVFVGLIFYIYSILGVSIWAGDIEYR